MAGPVYLARATALGAALLFLWQTGNGVWAGPYLQRVSGGDGACNRGGCPPKAATFGHYEPEWREWPAETRPDRTFPQSIGAEVLPTPPTLPPERLPKETITPTPSGAPATPGLPKLPAEMPPTLPGADGILPPDKPIRIEDGGRTPPPKETEPRLPLEPLPSQPRLPGETVPLLPEKTLPGETLPRLPAKTPPGEILPSRPEKPAPRPTQLQLPEKVQPQRPEKVLPGLPEKPQPGMPLEPATPFQEEPDAPGRAPALPRGGELPKPSGQSAPAPKPKEGANLMEPAPRERENVPEPVEPWAKPRPWRPEPARQTVYEERVDSWPQPRKPLAEQQLGGLPMERRAEPPVRRRFDMPADRPVERTAMPAAQPANVPLGLDGFCPVQLTENEAWVAGDARSAVQYQGRTYLMSDAARKERFLSNPGRYAPVMGGQDPVLGVDERSNVPGQTQFCVVYDGRLYMFSTAATLARFHQDPKRYAAMAAKGTY